MGMSAFGRRVVLMMLSALSAPVGSWALLAPRSFFDGFPGLGRHRVAGDGPYNEHLVRDVGALYLALLVLTLSALRRTNAGRARLVGVVWLVFGVPHVGYHVGHLGGLTVVDQLLSVAALSVVVVLAAALCLPPRACTDRRVTSGGAGSSMC